MARIYQMPQSDRGRGIPCITFDQIIDYIDDRLSSQEKAQAAKHLEECELCREAMEAAESHPDKEELRSFVDAVGEKFRSTLEPHLGAKRSDRGLYYRIAAVLVIGLASVLYLTRGKPHEKLFAEYFQIHPNIVKGSLERSEGSQGKLALAMLHYQRDEFTEALKFFEAVLQSEPDDTVYFFAGISYLATNNPDSAITCFRKVLDDGNNELRKPAEWYSGLAYLKKNDLENARAVFSNIISYDGPYKDDAMELLKRLDKLLK